MTRFTTTGRDQWNDPKHLCDARRRHIYGPLIPMQQDSFWKRLFSKPIRKVA